MLTIVKLICILFNLGLEQTAGLLIKLLNILSIYYLDYTINEKIVIGVFPIFQTIHSIFCPISTTMFRLWSLNTSK